MNFETFNEYIEIGNKYVRMPVVQIGLVLLLVYILLPNYLSSSVYLCEAPKISVGSCLDESWHLSINLANQKGFVFGKDYIFTYGALGVLSTRNALGFDPRYLILFDLFVLANLAYILFYTIRKYANLQTVFLCFLIAYTISSGSMYIDQIVFILLLILIFWLNYAVKHLQIWGLIIPVIVTCLLFYIKVNTGFIGLAVFYGYLIYFFVTDRQRYLPKILFGLSIPLLIFLLSFPLNTDLIGYIRGGLNLIDGYNDAMGLKLGDYQKYFARAIIVSALFFAFFLRKNLKANLMLLLAGLLVSFVLYKQGFVRADLHITAFFAIFPGICGVLLIFFEKKTPAQVAAAVFICIVCVSVGLRLNMYPSLKDRMNYLTDIVSPPDLNERLANSFNRFPLPDEARNVIGEGSVDIIPWNIDYIYFNQLNYNPRPIIQSYSAYTPYLMNINRQKYEGDSAPDFVIFSNQSIDNRYGFFDDQEAKLALIRDYSCLGFYEPEKDNKFLLFQRNPNNTIINFSPPVEKSIKFSEEYNLEDTGKSYFIKFDINPTLFGKAVRTFYKTPQLLINFTLEDGSTRLHRAILPILNNGVLINPVIEEEKDFFNFVNRIPVSNTKRMKSFRIELDTPEGIKRSIFGAAYDENIKFSVSEISLTKNN